MSVAYPFWVDVCCIHATGRDEKGGRESSWRPLALMGRGQDLGPSCLCSHSPAPVPFLFLATFAAAPPAGGVPPSLAWEALSWMGFPQGSCPPPLGSFLIIVGQPLAGLLLSVCPGGHPPLPFLRVCLVATASCPRPPLAWRGAPERKEIPGQRWPHSLFCNATPRQTTPVRWARGPSCSCL